MDADQSNDLQAIGSGDRGLIRNPEIRLLLGRYAEALDFVAETQDQVMTECFGELEPFLVANTDYAQVAWTGQVSNLVRGRFSTDAPALASRRDFYNLLNLKLELELQMVDALDHSLKLADEVLLRLASIS